LNLQLQNDAILQRGSLNPRGAQSVKKDLASKLNGKDQKGCTKLSIRAKDRITYRFEKILTKAKK
jgi:hypothetical protein